jgi:hypothetical protein
MKRRAIASTEVEAVFDDGRRKRIVLSVSAPWESDGHWLAMPTISGIREPFPPIAGDDSMQALILAMKCLIFRLESLQEILKFHLVWPDTKEKYSLRKFLFNPGRHPASK